MELTPSQERTREKDEAILRDVIRVLRAQFDTVQIFATRHSGESGEGETVGTTEGSGNYFARVGHISEWLRVQEYRAGEDV